MNLPAISIITPVFNGERFIGDCIENVAAQHCARLEHIVVDGGSTDRTVSILQEKSRSYTHLRFISEKDEGQSDALNKGVRMAKAKYLGILNFDDFYEAGVLNRVVQLIAGMHDDCFLVGNCRIIDGTGKIIAVNRPARLEIDRLLLPSYYEFPWNPSAYFYPRRIHDVVGPYDVDEHYAMDLKFILKTVQQIGTVHIDEIWGNMRFMEGTKSFEDDRTGNKKKRLRRIYWKAFVGVPIHVKARVLVRLVLYQSAAAGRRLRRSVNRQI